MITVTIAAHNRPNYLLQVLRSVGKAVWLCPELGISHTNVIVGIDPGGKHEDAVRSVASGFGVQTINWREHLGVSEHARRLIQFAFGTFKSTWNIHLEDDTVLSPDAFRLAEWYRNNFAKLILTPSFLFLSSESKDLGTDPALVTRRYDFGVWGWATNVTTWTTYLARTWNHRIDTPIGFDYSISDVMKQYGLFGLQPALSRVRNIGREDGYHTTPEAYDEEMSGLIAADESHIQEINAFHL